MYILNPRLAADIFDNEYIIANLDTGLYYSIQGLAVSLVKALPFEDPAAPIEKLAIAANDEKVSDELNGIWQQLLQEEIIRESNKPVAVNSDWAPATEYVASRFNRYADMQDLLMLDPIHEVDEEGWPVKKD
jgi:hypothetical protein